MSTREEFFLHGGLVIPKRLLFVVPYVGPFYPECLARISYSHQNGGRLSLHTYITTPRFITGANQRRVQI